MFHCDAFGNGISNNADLKLDIQLLGCGEALVVLFIVVFTGLCVFL